jgi:hypothetical protein
MKRYTNEQLNELEARGGFVLPGALRDFLVAEGAGRYGNVEIYAPETVDALYRDFFDDPSELFRLYIPFGETKQEQEMLVYRVSDGTSAKIWHETVPDDWPEEDWAPFDNAALRQLLLGA